MAQQGVTTYKSTKDTLLANNTSRQISEQDVRDVFENTADSFLNKSDEFRDPVKAYAATHSANNYTVTADNYSAYGTNIPLIIKPSATNSGSSPTINVNTLGAKTWKKADGGTYSASDVQADEFYVVVYDGVDFITVSGTNSVSPIAAGSNTEVQFNNAGTLGASSSFVWSGAALLVQDQSSTGFTATSNATSGNSAFLAQNADTDNLILRKYGSTATGTTAGESRASLSWLLSEGGTFLIETGDSQPIKIATNDTVRLTISSAGNFDFGGGELSNFTIATNTPSSASDTGTAGEIAYDSSYIYICTATDTWKRVAISTW